MSKKPGDWWDHSWNPIEGCSRLSEACENCWALGMLNRFRGLQPGEIKRYPERIPAPFGWKKPCRIFVGSLTDLFHEDIISPCSTHFNTLDDIFKIVDLVPLHTYVFLTKRPANVHHFLFDSKRGAFSDNAWIGTTIENQDRYNERAPLLFDLLAETKFLHLEPLLGPVDIRPALRHIQWVVVGGENGIGGRPMHADWVRVIRDECGAAGVPFWFKSWGQWNMASGKGFLNNRLIDGREYNELPEAADGQSGC